MNVDPEISILVLVSFSGTSRRLAWVSCSSTALGRLFLVGSDSAISQQRNAESRAALEQGGLRARSTKLLLHLSSMEGGHCSNLFELAYGYKGAWPARSVSRAIRATPSKSRTWLMAGRHASDISQGSDGSSADSQTALRGRTDFFRLNHSGYGCLLYTSPSPRDS